MKDPVIKLLIVYILAVFFLIGCALLFSSCKLTRDVSKSSSDSTAVKKDETVYSKVDSSKSSKEKDSDRVTFIYPVDTTVNNYYTYPSTVIYEKVKEKEQSETFNAEAFKRELLDSISKKEESKQVESQTKIGPSTLEWVLLVIGALIVLRLLKKWEIL